MQDNLETRLALMAEDELVHLGARYESLTDEAKALVRAEFARRSLDAPILDDPEPLVEAQKVRTIRRYGDQVQALFARSVLESAGIHSFLRDENTICIYWLWSDMIGGIRLQVAEEDVEAAEAVLAQPVPQTIALGGDLVYHQPHCPRCGSLDTSSDSFAARMARTTMAPSEGQQLSGPNWYCQSCTWNWGDDSENLPH